MFVKPNGSYNQTTNSGHIKCIRQQCVLNIYFTQQRICDDVSMHGLTKKLLRLIRIYIVYGSILIF